MKDLFEEKAKDWDASDRKTTISNAISASIIDQVELTDDMSVMDFGAGTGLVTGKIAPHVKRVTAVDISEAMLEKLAAKAELKEKVDIACQDITTQPLADRYDLIVSAMALHHVEDTTGLLSTFRNHLNDNGMIALADLDEEDGSFHEPGTEGIYHQGFNRTALTELLTQQGFEQVEFCTALDFQGDEKNYPIFLVTAKKA